MNEDRLERNLNSVGKSCFVEFYKIFSDQNRYSHSEAAEILKNNTDYTEKSCNSRVSHARSIFRSNLEIKALELIVNSRSSESVINRAHEIMRLQRNQ